MGVGAELPGAGALITVPLPPPLPPPHPARIISANTATPFASLLRVICISPITMKFRPSNNQLVVRIAISVLVKDFLNQEHRRTPQPSQSFRQRLGKPLPRSVAMARRRARFSILPAGAAP